MWHPFDLIPSDLEVSPDIRNAKPESNCTVSFGEKALTYFTDKSSKTEQWPLMMDELPGIRITRWAGVKEVALEITHQWRLDYLRTLSGTMRCSAEGWHSPYHWSFLRTFKPMFPGAVPFSPVEVRGSWNRGELAQSSLGNGRKHEGATAAATLLSTYALMAGFPVQEATLAGEAVLLGEDLIVAPSVVLHRCPNVLQRHPLAKGLMGYMVEAQGNFPTEFWVNEHGLVVYVFNGISKILVLNSVEGVA